MVILRSGLPLLTLELQGRTARRSTWLYRMVMTVGLAIVALFLLLAEWPQPGRFPDPTALLGLGRHLLAAIVGTLFVGIYGLLPPISCGAITEERQRHSLDLLMLTRLGPWRILFEKLCSRLVQILALLLAALPLLALAYSFGGIDSSLLPGAMWLLFVTSLHVISVSILASTICRRTPAAFLLTWIMGIAVSVTPILLSEAGLMATRYESLLFPPAVFDLMVVNALTVSEAVLWMLPLLAVSGVAFTLSRYCLTRPARTAGIAPGRTVVTKIDAMVRRMVPCLKASPHTRDAGRPLPGNRPVRWKELFGGMLRHPRHHWYFAGGLTVLVLLGCGLAAAQSDSWGAITAACLFATGFAMLAVVTKSVMLFSSERSRQTLEILLTTPLPNATLLRDKFSGINHVITLLAVPLLIMFVCSGLLRPPVQSPSLFSSPEPFSFSFYLTSLTVTVWISLQMFAWLAVLIGLVIHKPAVAVTASLAAIFAWTVIPFFVLYLCVDVFPLEMEMGTVASAAVLLASPPTCLILALFDTLHFMGIPRLSALLLNSLIHGSILLSLRRTCCHRIDRLLDRNDSPAESARPVARRAVAWMVHRIRNSAR